MRRPIISTCWAADFASRVARRTWIGGSSISSGPSPAIPTTRCCTPRSRTATRSRPCSPSEPPLPLFARAREAATRALALDPDLADAHATLGHLKWRFEFDWAGAEEEYLRAIALDPRNATAHYRLALLRGFAADSTRDWPRWRSHASSSHSGRRRRPTTPGCCVLAGRYAEGEAEARRAIEIDPDFAHSRSVLGRALLGQQRYDEALEAFRSRKASRSGELCGCGGRRWPPRDVWTRRGRSSTDCSCFRDSTMCQPTTSPLATRPRRRRRPRWTGSTRPWRSAATLQAIRVDPALRLCTRTRASRPSSSASVCPIRA